MYRFISSQSMSDQVLCPCLQGIVYLTIAASCVDFGLINS